MVRLTTVLLLVMLMGCAREDTGTIVFAVATAPAVLDPRLASDAASERTNALLYDRLVLLDEQGTPQPAMAEWQRIDPRRYRLSLLPDRASFWDGRLPDAADVVATYRSVLDKSLGSPHAGALAHVADVSAVDDTRIDFALARPDPLFPARLTLGILPAESLQAGGPVPEPIGSGPFAFDGWREDGGLTLVRRSDGQRIALVPVADPTMRALKLLRGEAQLLQNDLPSELFAHLAAAPGLELRERSGTTFAYIGFNLADRVVSDRNIRLAIAHAIDREAIIKHLFDGRAQPAESVLPRDHWAGAEGLAPLAHDPARARDYLQRAGYDETNPLVLSYKTSTDPFRLRIAHVFQSQLAEVGIRMRIASYDWGTFFGDIKAGRFQIYSLAWVGVNTPDILRYAFHSASEPPGGANRGGYRSPVVDGLIERAEIAETAEQAASLYAEAQRLIHADLVYLPLWYEANVAASRGLSGYLPGHDGNYLALSSVRWADDAP